jgi:hypothetical protein
MPRMTVNLNAPNVEQLEFKFDEVKEFIDNNPGYNGHRLTEKITIALDEAHLQIDQEGSELEYVIIKIVK